MARTLQILVLDGVADGSVGITLDLLGTAARIVKAGLVPRVRSPFAPRIVSLDGGPVRTAARRSLAVDGALSLRGFGRDDALVMPGLGMATPAQIESSLMRDDVRRAARAMARAAARGGTVAASCSATFVLAASGVLDGREATTTWWLGPELARRFPRVVLRSDQMVVASGRAFTAGAAFAHADLMLALLARASGPTLAQLVSRYLLVDARPSQARYMIAQHLRADDPQIRAFERCVLANLDRTLTVRELAAAAATTPRTLARRLASTLDTTPLRFAQRLKVERAVHLLETTDAPVDAIARSVGYADPAAFRRVLRRETGKAPRELRAPR